MFQHRVIACMSCQGRPSSCRHEKSFASALITSLMWARGLETGWLMESQPKRARPHHSLKICHPQQLLELTTHVRMRSI
eukprot:5495663-Amphidinium_carterae.1